jgi:hypothetical protein
MKKKLENLMKVKVVRGDILVDISKEKLGNLIDIVREKGIESTDEILQELDILMFHDFTGKHESRYLELRKTSSKI